LLLIGIPISGQTDQFEDTNPYYYINSANKLIPDYLDSSFSFAERGLKLALQETNDKAEAHCYNTIGSINFELNKFEQAIESFSKAHLLFRSLGEENEEYLSLKYLARAHDASSNTSIAIEKYEQLLERAELLGNEKDTDEAQRALGRLYFNAGSYEMALALFEKRKEKAEAEGNSEELALIFNHIGKIYDVKNDSVKAFDNYEQGLTNGLNSESNDAVQGYYQNVNSFYSSRGNVEGQLEVNEKAIEYFSNQKQKISKRKNKSKNEEQAIQNIEENLYQSNYNQGQAYLNSAKPIDAIPYLKTSIDIATDIGVLENEVLGYEALFEAYEKVGDYNQALLAYKEFVRSKDSLIREKENEKLLALKLEAALSDRDKHIALLKKEASLDHMQFDLTLKEKEDEARISKILMYSLLAGISILLVSLLVFLRGNREKKKANKLLLLKSLRTQMNPHFIFNSLNSVNSFISQSDERSANKYLSEFSRLMRMVLENSKYDFVSLASEVKTLELYIGLEHLRFENKFDFRFEIDVSSVDEVQVPPMLIQPYIENAVWHGLRYGEEKGTLKVSCAESKDSLHWVIQDNGIGRTRSKELKTKHQAEGKSTGMKNTEERLRIIKQLYDQEITLSVSDLKEDGTGTKVELVIPKKYD
jgi:tetratricopeptide (TPR) repeat protein